MSKTKLLSLPISHPEITFNKLSQELGNLKKVNGIKEDFNIDLDILKKLHGHLDIHMKEHYPDSWLKNWWLDGYFTTRGNLTFDSNYAQEILFGKNYEYHSEFLNKFVSSFVKVKDNYLLGKYNNVKNSLEMPLCRSQLEVLKGAGRVLEREKDSYYIGENSHHITVFYKNQLYKVNVSDNLNKDYTYTFNTILNQIEEISTSISTLSFEGIEDNYDKKIEIIERNKEYFEILKTSLFNLTIVEKTFDNNTDKYLYNLYLEGENSNVCKTFNFVYNLSTKDLFINIEHSYQDGMTIVEILNYIKEEFDNYPVKDSLNLENYFVCVDEKIEEDEKILINDIKNKYNQKVSNYRFKEISLDVDSITGIKFSKDCFLQMLIQYGVKKSYGEYKSTYEPVDMKEYKGGRTECVRPNSGECIELIEALIKGEDIETIKELYFKAEFEHKKRIKDSKNGLGFDRHLFGLKKFAGNLSLEEQESFNKFLQSETFIKFTNNFISTTSLGDNKYLGVPFFSPVVDNGLGIAYSFGKTQAKYIISFKKSESDIVDKFVGNLTEGYEKLKEIFYI